MTNFTGTLAVDAAGVALAAMGYLHPVFAALIHVTSELVFILNSARLLAGSSSKALMTVAQSRAPLASVQRTSA
jgi:Cd2+/Zn2+-exporting ATPase/Cu+-exporting ATPase